MLQAPSGGVHKGELFSGLDQICQAKHCKLKILQITTFQNLYHNRSLSIFQFAQKDSRQGKQTLSKLSLFNQLKMAYHVCFMYPSYYNNLLILCLLIAATRRATKAQKVRKVKESQEKEIYQRYSKENKQKEV